MVHVYLSQPSNLNLNGATAYVYIACMQLSKLASCIIKL